VRIIIAGGGKILHFLTKSFLSKGHNVTIIHNDKGYCAKLAKKHPAATVVFGNGTRPEVLEDAGAHYANAILAITLNDPENLIICQIAQKIFQIPKTFARVNDPRNVEIFKKLGVTDVISTAQVISSMIEQKVFLEDIINLTPIEEGQVALLELEVQDSYPIVNKTLAEINITKDAIIGCVLRGEEAIIPRGDTIINTQDKLIILSLPQSQSLVLKALSGRID
jgi:trk system potassium uptake protein